MEQVILLDEAGAAIGVADKATVHHQNTPLHLAFSTYVFNADGALLLTRRADTKPTWPGVWTNSCCGHPAPGETILEAIPRRLRDELGLTAIDAIDPLLPSFRYHARMPNGIAENELCPVFRVMTGEEPTPQPGEVAEARWVSWPDFVDDVSHDRLVVSPWCEQQMDHLRQLGTNPKQWHVVPDCALPPFARPPAAAAPR